MPLLLLHGSRGIWLKLRFGSLSVLWISGFILLGIPLAEGFLGYILDWGQMSYRGVTAMINILVTLFPVYMSSCLPESIWRSCNVIISRIFVLHFSLGILIGGFISVHPYVSHCYSSSNPLFNSSSSIVPFFPLPHKDIFVSMVIFIGSHNYIYVSMDILGNSDNQVNANPVATPNHTLPERYSSLVHNSPRAFPKKRLGLIAVILLMLLL
jgi:ubiquinol-cytochrome c reductase cytochrome b/c1 subunit